MLESRLARGWHTQELAREQIARLTGWRIPQSVYAEWESGRRVPSEANLGRLQQFYGTQEETAPPVGEAGLVAALTRQAEAIERQAEAITALTQEIRIAALSVLSGQQGTGELLAELVSAAESGKLGELLTELRAGSVPEAPGR